MKNILIVDIDTDREPIVKLGKTDESHIPKNDEQAKEFIIKDMACLTEALCTLIHAADQSNFKTIDESIKDIIKHIEINTSNNDLKK